MSIAVLGRGKISWLVEEILADSAKLVFYDDRIAGLQKTSECAQESLIIAIGDAAVRRKLYNQYSKLQILSVISPRAVVSKLSTIGRGSIISHHCAIHAHANLGEGVFIYSNVVVDSHSAIGAFTRIGSQTYVGERVRIGNDCVIGAGVKFLTDVTIGNNCEVAAGSVITRSFSDNEIIAGYPARSVKEKA